MTEKLLLRLTLDEKILSEQIIHLDPTQKVQQLMVNLPNHEQKFNSKKYINQNPQPPEEHHQKDQNQDEQNIPIMLPFYSFTNLDKDYNIILLILYRIFLAIYATKNFVHSDEYSRTTEVAYHIVHGDVPLDDEWKSIHPTLNTLYQLYLSQSISFLDYYGVYDAQTIRAGVYISHAILLIIGDILFYKLVKISEGPLIARITMYIYFSMKFYNMYVIRCFNESIITILSIMTLYCFVKLQNKFNRYYIFLWFLIIIQLFQRVTTIFTWIPLILYQIIQRKKNCNYFVIGLFYGGLSSLILNIVVDTTLYEQFTVTIFNQLFFYDIKSRIDVNLISLFNYVYVDLPKSFNTLYIPLVLQFAITLVDIVLERKFSKITLFAITQFILQVLQTNQNEYIVLSVLPFLMVIIARLFNHGFQGKYRYYFKILFIAAILYEIVLHLSFVMFSNRKQDAVQFIMENDDRPVNIYHGNMTEVPFYTITHKVSYKKIIRTINTAYSGGRYGGQTLKIEDTNEQQWQCSDLLNTFYQGQETPKYIVLNHFEKEPYDENEIYESYDQAEAKVGQIQDCIDILESHGGYKLEAVFGILPKYWQDLFAKIHLIDIKKILKIKTQPVYVFKIKDYD